MRHLCTLALFHTQHANSLLLLIHIQVQCDLAITRDTCVNIYLLNCLNLFFKYKICQSFLVCLWIQECFASRVEVWFKCLTCFLDACLSSHLVAFSSYVFFPLEKYIFYILNSFSTDTSSIKIFGFDFNSFSTDRSIHQAKILCSLFAQHILDRFSIHRGFWASPRQILQSVQILLHAFFFLCFAFFSFCAHNILFSFSCRSMVPCSPRALYVSFLFVSSQFFGFLGPLTIVSKSGRNLRIECHSSRGVINLGENFMLKGRNFLI